MAQVTGGYPGDLVEHLRAFVTLADACTQGRGAVFTRAAQRLALDVSVLRRRIATFAGHVGAPLFRGRGDVLRLTPFGEQTYASALRALEALGDVLSASVRAVAPLRVASTGTIVGELLPPVLAELRRRHPRITLRVHRAGAEGARTLLDRGEVDFAIVRASARPSGVSAMRIAQDRLWLATAAKSELAHARPTPARVAREPFVGYGPRSSTMERVLDVLEPLGAEPSIAVDGKAAALRYVEEGLGVAFVSAVASYVPRARGVVFRDVTAWFAPVAFWLLEDADARRSSVHDTFKSLVASAARAR